MNSPNIPRPHDLPNMTIVEAEPFKGRKHHTRKLCNHSRVKRGEECGKGKTGSRGYEKNHRSSEARRYQHQEPLYEGYVEPLKVSSNRWKSSKSNSSTVGGAINLVKSILNKLTRERFEKLASQLIELNIDTLAMLSSIETFIL